MEKIMPSFEYEPLVPSPKLETSDGERIILRGRLLNKLQNKQNLFCKNVVFKSLHLQPQKIGEQIQREEHIIQDDQQGDIERTWGWGLTVTNPYIKESKEMDSNQIKPITISEFELTTCLII